MHMCYKFSDHRYYLLLACVYMYTRIPGEVNLAYPRGITQWMPNQAFLN
jgi:hypothetical protein